MGDEDRRDADAPRELAKLRLHGLSEIAIECGQRLVQEYDVRVEHDGPCEGDSLLLPSRQLARIALLESGESYGLERAPDQRRLVSGLELAHLEPERDVLPDREVRKEGKALEHHADAPPEGRQMSDVPVADSDLARVRSGEARNDSKGRGLAASARSEQRDELPGGHVERQGPERLHVPESLADVSQRNRCHCLTSP